MKIVSQISWLLKQLKVQQIWISWGSWSLEGEICKSLMCKVGTDKVENGKKVDCWQTVVSWKYLKSKKRWKLEELLGEKDVSWRSWRWWIS